MSVSLSIIIVNWNVWEDLCECLESIFASTFSEEMEVILVDNASSDRSVTNTQSHFPDVKIVANSANVGFPKANNQGLEIATGEFVLFLNPDTVLRPDTLAGCIACMRSQTDVGLMGCKVVYPDGNIQYECARNLPSLRSTLWAAFYLHMLFPKSPLFGEELMGDWDHQTSRDVPCLLGAFMVGRRSILQKLGGMDVSVFMFLEDVDLCLMVKRDGWRVYYLADFVVVHKSMASQKKMKKPMTYQNATARYEFFKKHYSLGAARLCRLLFFIGGVVRLLFSLILFPLAFFSDRFGVWLRNAHKPQVQLELLRWVFGYRSLP